MDLQRVSKKVTTVVSPGTQVSSRNDIYEQESVKEEEEEVKEEAERMDALMRNLLGGQSEEEQDDMDQDDNAQQEQEEEFAFRLFASQPVAKVTIADVKDDTDSLSKAIAEKQEYEFDETEPEFLARVKEVAIDYTTIMEQSTIPYPTAKFPRRVIHIPSIKEQAEKEAAEKKKSVKKRKSKKCRDFEKAIKEGRIKLEPNMRNPNTPGGWPGWPGELTKVAIVDYVSSKKSNHAFSGRNGSTFQKTGRGSHFGGGNRGSFRGRGFSKPNGSRGGGFSSRGSRGKPV
ncbi:uncharacterized protein B0P05DRAFT_522873 [Gilbertella persicaria]|uniref:uncharacterized protein n=1 Tax=Gilbertella persicaria TaxID=101096 RepID=UPI00221F9395|nr:uncharacterized protein B0P05DRAFT_522873 [Gilbertella persicaria]KAI8097988.1 hypothetical protein B0P05DRAFT_522873 [Gilbertella persicaria]